MEVKSHEKSEKHIILRMEKENGFVRRFPGFPQSSV